MHKCVGMGVRASTHKRTTWFSSSSSSSSNSSSGSARYTQLQAGKEVEVWQARRGLQALSWQLGKVRACIQQQTNTHACKHVYKYR